MSNRGDEDMQANGIKYIKHIYGYQGDARLYRLNTPIPYDYDYNTDKFKESTGYVVISAVIVPYSGPETYIFPSNEDGKILDWGELKGSYQGGLDHDMAIEKAGWILE